jgi:hypothetical protein
MNQLERSEFARALTSLFDDTGLFTRKEWADLIGVSPSAVSQWLSDATVPRADHLYMIFDTLKGSDVPQQPLDNFRRMAELPAITVSPHGKRMLPTVWAYMTRPAFDALSNQLAKLDTKEQEELLENAFKTKVPSHRGANKPVKIADAAALSSGGGLGSHPHSKCFLSHAVERCPDNFQVAEVGAGFIKPFITRIAADDSAGSELRWEELQQLPRVILFSQPGCGKTTVLRRLVSEILSAEPRSSTPIYMHMPCLATLLATSTLASTLKAFTADMVPDEITLLLDGLDEVPGNARKRILDSLFLFLDECPQTSVIVASRPLSCEPGLKDFVQLAIEPFSYSQVQRWVYERLARNYWNSEPRRGARVETYFYDLRERPDVMSVLRIPLFLAVSTSLFARNSVTPFYASDIISQCLRTLVGEWDRKKNVVRAPEPWGTPDHILKILSRICFHTLQTGHGTFRTDALEPWLRDLACDSTPIRVLQVLAESTGVLEACPDNEWRITHKTLQEFLAAKYVVESCQDVNELLKTEFRSQDFHRVTRFALGITNDGSQLLEFILGTDQLKEAPKMVLLADVLAQPFMAKHAVISHSCDTVVRWLETAFSNWTLELTLVRGKEADADRRWWLKAYSEKPKPSLESQTGQNARQVLKSIHLARSGPARPGFLDRLKSSAVPVLKHFGTCLDVDGQFRDRVVKDDGAERLVAEVVEMA